MRTTKCTPSTKRGMKSVSLFIFLFSFLCAGCGEELTPQTQPTTTFTIETPAVTRAEVTGLSRYIVEAYEGNDLTTTPVRVESSTGSLTIALKKETDYTFLFWADKGDYWNTADLKAVAVTTDKKNDAGQAAYCLCVSFNSKDFEANKSVTLKNATAQVNFVETAGLAAANNTLKVTYATGAALNVGTGKVTEVAGEVVHTYTAIAQAAPNATLAADYVLAPLNEKSVVNLTVQFNDEAEKAIGNVPFQQSYRTNIKGEYSNLYNSVFTISNEVGDYEDGGEVETDPLPPFTVTNTVKGGLQAAIAAAGLTASPKIIILGPVDDVDMRYVGSLTTLKELDLSGATLWGKAAENAAETENTLTYQAFYRGDNELNTTLTAVTLPASLEIIGYRTFYECIALTSIAIPTSVTSIGEEAFFECTKLETITFAGTSQLETIGNYAFNYCSALTSIAIPASVTSIGGYAFYSCSKLATVTFAGTSQLETIGEAAFYSCSALTSIGIPASVTSIGLHAFEGCYKLAMVTFAGTSQLETIGNYVFNSCTALTSIAIPASVTSIGLCAFTSCSLLKSITLHNSTTMIPYAQDLLYDTPALTDIYVPSTLVDTYKAANGWKNFAAKIQPIP